MKDIMSCSKDHKKKKETVKFNGKYVILNTLYLIFRWVILHSHVRYILTALRGSWSCCIQKSVTERWRIFWRLFWVKRGRSRRKTQSFSKIKRRQNFRIAVFQTRLFMYLYKYYLNMKSGYHWWFFFFFLLQEMDLKTTMTKATARLKTMFASSSNNNHKILYSMDICLWLSKNNSFQNLCKISVRILVCKKWHLKKYFDLFSFYLLKKFHWKELQVLSSAPL